MTAFSPVARSSARPRVRHIVEVGTAVLLTAAAVAAPLPAAAAGATGATAAAQSKTVVRVATSPVGSILTDAKGRTVYLFMSDKKGVSTCTGQCLTYWPPVAAPTGLPSTLPGISGKLGSITRPDTGTRQLTINGKPLYTYAGDTKPGMISGQGSNGGGALWWVVAPSGKKITKAAPGAAS